MRRIGVFVLLSVLTASCAGGLAPAGAAGQPPPAASAKDPVRSSLLGEQRSDGGAVEIVAAWVATDPPSLKVTMDTHSFDLDGSDLAVLARARLDGGDWVGPSAVDVALGDHHREGTLQFAPLGASFGAARVIELEIREVAVPLRILRWERGP